MEKVQSWIRIGQMTCSTLAEASPHAESAAVHRDRHLRRCGRVMTAGIGPNPKDQDRIIGQGQIAVTCRSRASGAQFNEIAFQRGLKLRAKIREPVKGCRPVPLQVPSKRELVPANFEVHPRQVVESEGARAFRPRKARPRPASGNFPPRCGPLRQFLPACSQGPNMIPNCIAALQGQPPMHLP